MGHSTRRGAAAKPQAVVGGRAGIVGWARAAWGWCTQVVIALMSAPLARMGLTKARQPRDAATWRAVKPCCGGEADEGWGERFRAVKVGEIDKDVAVGVGVGCVEG
jgi:hypothetical protein